MFPCTSPLFVQETRAPRIVLIMRAAAFYDPINLPAPSTDVAYRCKTVRI
jgi:hypothetical protein